MIQIQQRGSVMHQKLHTKCTVMERRTMTMDWEGLLDDDDDDRFFESFDRLSSAVPIDLASSGSDNDEGDDSRTSFASAISSAPIHNMRGIDPARAQASMLRDFNMWMAEPGSIKERRRRLLQGMGLSSNKNLLSRNNTRLKDSSSKRMNYDRDQPSTMSVNNSSPLEDLKLDTSPSPSSTPIFLIRSRSDGDIESFSANTDYVHVPETVFSLSERPVCSFTGHLDDVLDLSWSKSHLLLSASMDKTVRLWDMETRSCLKLFAHNDYVTCIQFNPTDDDYFISGSLDAKVRIWSIPDRKLVDYTDLHEMVTSACYTPDGQGAMVGSNTGSCHLYSTADCRLEQKAQIETRNRKKSQAKKITGFEFAPSNTSEVLVTSADSRIRIIDGSEIIHKFRGFRNTSSQISASFSPDGKYVVCASEDSQVYIWKREEQQNAGAGKRKLVTTHSHEHFQCRDVSVAIPWPGSIKFEPPVVEVHSKRHSKHSTPCPPTATGSPTQEDILSGSNGKRLPPLPKRNSLLERAGSCQDEELAQVPCTDSGFRNGESFSLGSSSVRYGYSPSISGSGSSPSQTWSSSWSLLEGSSHGGHGSHTVQATAWGLVIVTAGLGGEIRAYQNFGLPVKVRRQTNLFRDLT